MKGNFGTAIMTFVGGLLATCAAAVVYPQPATAITILVQFDGKDKVTYDYASHEAGKKKIITIMKEVPKSDVTAAERMRFSTEMNKRYQGTGVNFIDDPTKPHDGTLDITDSNPSKETGGTQFGLTGEDRKGAWVFEQKVKTDFPNASRDQIITFMINVADHEAGHMAGLNHGDTGLMKPLGSWTAQEELDLSLQLTPQDKQQLQQNQGKKDLAPGVPAGQKKQGQSLSPGLGTGQALMVFAGIPDAPTLHGFDDAVDVTLRLVPNTLDNPLNPFNASFDLGYLNRSGEFIFMTNSSSILNMESPSSFLAGDTLLLSLRDSTGNVYNTLTGHGLPAAFSNPVGDTLFVDADIGFDLNLDGTRDVTLQLHTENDPGCGTG